MRTHHFSVISVAVLAAFTAVAQAQMPTPSQQYVHTTGVKRATPVTLRNQYIHDQRHYDGLDGIGFYGSNDIYVGVSGGASYLTGGREDLSPGPVKDTLDNDTGYNAKAYVGAFFSDHFGMEYAVHYMDGIVDQDGSTDDGPKDDDFSALAGSASLVGRYGVNANLIALAKVGALYGRVLEKDGNTRDRFGATDWAPIIGGGLDYQIQENLFLRAEVEYINGFGSIPPRKSGKLDLLNVNVGFGVAF